MRPHSPPSRAEKRHARAYFSYSVFALSLVAGIALGIALTRLHGPLQRGNAEPWQLQAAARHHYMIAIALEYAHTGDLPLALTKLIAMRPAQDPLSALADAACALGSGGYLRNQSGINALRGAVALYAAQGRSGCVEKLLPPEAAESPPAPAWEPNENLSPAPALPTKPPLPESESATTVRRLAPTPPPPRAFEARAARSYCDAMNQALLEVRVVDYLGRGLPGQRVRVRWGNQEDVFISGLKADRGDAYADFQMQEGIDYAIDMPGAAEPLGASLSTGLCYAGSRRALKSWRVSFVER